MYYLVLLLPTLMVVISGLPLLSPEVTHKVNVTVLSLCIWLLGGLCITNGLLYYLYFCKPHVASIHFPLFSSLNFDYIRIGWQLSFTQLTFIALNIISSVFLIIFVFLGSYFSHEPSWVSAKIMFYLSLVLLFSNVLFTTNNLYEQFCSLSVLSLLTIMTISAYAQPQHLKQAVIAYLLSSVGDLCFLLALVLSLTLFYTSDFYILCVQTLPGHNLGYLYKDSYVLLIKILFVIAICSKCSQLIFAPILARTFESAPSPIAVTLQVVNFSAAGLFMLFKFLPWLSTSYPLMKAVSWLGLITMLVSVVTLLFTCRLKIQISYFIVFHLGAIVMAVGLRLHDLAAIYSVAHLLCTLIILLCFSIILLSTCGDQNIYTMGGLASAYKWLCFMILGCYIVSFLLAGLVSYEALNIYDTGKFFKNCVIAAWYGGVFLGGRFLIVSFFKKPYFAMFSYNTENNKLLYGALALCGIFALSLLFWCVRHDLLNRVLYAGSHIYALNHYSGLKLIYYSAMSVLLSYLICYKELWLVRVVWGYLRPVYTLVENVGYEEKIQLLSFIYKAIIPMLVKIEGLCCFYKKIVSTEGTIRVLKKSTKASSRIIREYFNISFMLLAVIALILYLIYLKYR